MLPLVLLILIIPAAALPALLPSLGFIEDITPTRIVGGVVFIWVLLRNASHSERSRIWSSSFSKWYLIFIIITLASGLYTALIREEGAGVRERFTQLLSFILFLFVIMSCVKRLRDVETTIWASVIAMSVFGMASVLSFMFGGVKAQFHGREAGLALDPNYLAVQLVLIIPMAGYLYQVTANPSLKILAACCTGILLLAEVSTMSRAGIAVGLPAAAITVVCLSRHKAKVMAVLLVIMMMGGVLMMSTSAGRRFASQFMERIKKTRVVQDIREATSEAEVSTTARLSLFFAGIDMALRNPIIGVGPHNFFWSSINYGMFGKRPYLRNMAHNMYLSIGGELGLIALTSFLAMIWITLRDLVRIRKYAWSIGNMTAYHLSTSMIVALMSFCVASLFIHSEGEKFFWLIMFLTVAFGRSMRAEYYDTSDESEPQGERTISIDRAERNPPSQMRYF